jgi:reactive intermediate/imine deaminase
LEREKSHLLTTFDDPPAPGGHVPHKRFFAPDLPEPISHFADAVRAGNLLFISGIISVDKSGNVLGEGDAAEQTRVILENMKTLLTMSRATFADVVKVTVFLTNIDDRAKINPIRQQYFGESRPASSLVEVSKLVVPGCLVEIEAIAVVGSD